jgi:hypothetical protein
MSADEEERDVPEDTEEDIDQAELVEELERNRREVPDPDDEPEELD